MVDPNRKINRFTEKDIEFLEECEREFSFRFTEDDAEFMGHCSKALSDPPIIENWNSGDFSRNEGGNRHHNRNQRNWRDNFGHRRGGRNNYDDNGHRRGGRNHYDEDNGHRRGNRNHNDGDNGSSVRKPYTRPAFNQQSNKSSSPMNIRRDYSNFVAASKDD